MSDTTLLAAFLGLIEGLTEFIPVSSTGHLLLFGHFLGFNSAGRTFEVVIQLGAVLAILTIYSGKLIAVARAAPRDRQARRFLWSILIAFLPAAVIGVFAHKFIKTVLFETPMLIAVMLILGGVLLLFVDRFAPRPRHDDAMRLPLNVALRIGLFQCLAMVPGTSRSGATIVGALLMGVGKRAAAEFSFFLSMPTMAGAFAYDLWANRAVLDLGAVSDIAVGLACAFVTAALVVKWLLGFVSRNGYAFFGWWRITAGVAALALLFVLG
ncbi:undecaprenyl-diphosphate phosphatase [Roseovarius spongiae]|uniref:Undecaprenyl-diphosphatase n=1 Tax=Roseovarius spongiae TaxID=2320272 RepID=A0A3A8B4K7_9RHOB|nr:undecaprenyl-diphosphate phosphatase [Roseovarius spongiae]RKF13437.1 undecaprenyl-diphosphate phosphatase [Roseovarius spongiae]